MYHSPASKSAAWAAEIVVDPIDGLVSPLIAPKFTCTPAFAPGGAGPWKKPTVGRLLRPLQLMFQLNIFVISSSAPDADPMAPGTDEGGGTTWLWSRVAVQGMLNAKRLVGIRNRTAIKVIIASRYLIYPRPSLSHSGFIKTYFQIIDLSSFKSYFQLPTHCVLSGANWAKFSFFHQMVHRQSEENRWGWIHFSTRKRSTKHARFSIELIYQYLLNT